jgi:pilus assembly protein CpaC
MKSMEKSPMKKLFAVVAAVAGLVAGAAAWADDVALEFGGRKATELRLPMGRSQIISSAVALEQVVIGSPDVADIKLLSAGRVLILGIKPGRTNLVFRQKGGDLVALMDVVVGYDLNGIKQKIYDVMPAEDRLKVRDTNDRLILSGEVSSAYAMDMALNVARSYVPADKVVNLMQVSGGSQVMLEARIAEISRDSLKDLGIQTTIKNNVVAPLTEWSISTGTNMAGAFGTVDWNKLTGSSPDDLNIKLQALEKKGLAKTLAEPNLVALSGQEANFLAGGEIPIPVANGNSGVSIDYKEFGVGLRFTPTVLDASKINLKLVSEVSSIGTTPTVMAGYTVPSLNTRRAGTTIELADGQSFAIAGLMQSDMTNAVNQFPLLGDIPVLGALFRSTDFQRNETELVIVVTARLVKPTTAAKLALPTDVFTPPSDLDQYLLGRLEGTPKDRQYPARDGGQGGAAGGMENSVGHQVKEENGNAK